jgi:hypothetical protein
VDLEYQAAYAEPLDEALFKAVAIWRWARTDIKSLSMLSMSDFALRDARVLPSRWLSVRRRSFVPPSLGHPVLIGAVYARIFGAPRVTLMLAEAGHVRAGSRDLPTISTTCQLTAREDVEV